LQIDIGRTACGESRSPPADRPCPPKVTGFRAWTDASELRPDRKRRLGGTRRSFWHCLGLRSDVPVHSTWRRFNPPALSGLHCVHCGGRIFDPYSIDRLPRLLQV